MDLGLIKKKITEDKSKITSSYRRYPVRFLFMELSKTTQDDILELVKGSNGELLELSDFIMKKDDGWLTKSHFLQVIKENVSKEKDTFVVGFSEMIRFYSFKEIESILLSLFDNIENCNLMDEKASSRRIYFICFSMMDNVTKILQNSFARKDLIDPFINPEFEVSSERRQVCFVSDEYSDNIKKNKIMSSVDWIGLWRHSNILDFSEPIWCCSESLYEWHKKASPDNAFQIDVITNTKEYLQKKIGYEIRFNYLSEEDYYWKNLVVELDRINKCKSISDLCSYILEVNSLQTYLLAGKYISTENEFDKWLIRNYAIAYLEDSYFCKVMKHTNTTINKDFLINVWIQGYRISNGGLLEERLGIIKELNKYAGTFTPEQEIKAEILEGLTSELDLIVTDEGQSEEKITFEVCMESSRTNVEMKNRIISYYSRVFKPAYTGISNTEKEFLINLYSQGVIDQSELKVMYPSLYEYLFGMGDNLIHDKNEYKIYLDNYRKSKVRNSDTSYLADYYAKGCASADNLYATYYNLEKQDILVQKYANENTDIFVLDGVGAEYTPVLIYFLKENGYDVEICDYASAHLPSITEINKTYLNSVKYNRWILNFDREVIHGEVYKFQNNIRKSLDVLKKIIKEITDEASERRILITADHGATARAKWTETKKKYNFIESDHEGRCCKIDSKTDYENTEDYIVFEDEINSDTTYVISINETSLLNRPKYEDHGGATLEELLVPIIVAVPHRIKKAVEYKIFDEKMQVNGLDKVVKFTIIPNPETAYLVDGDGVKHDLNKVNGLYQAELSSGREQEITVVVEDKDYKFNAINVAKKNMEGDDGFDD